MATARKWREGWQARWYDPHGNQATKSGFKTRKEALNYGSLMEADKFRGVYNDPKLAKTPFNDWVDHWLATKQHLKPSTLESYESALRTHILPEFGGMQLGKIDPIQVQEWVADMRTRGMSSSRMRQSYQCLSAILKFAVESGYLGRTPCVGVSIPRVPVRDKLFLDAWQVKLLAEAIKEPHETLIYVLAYGGVRWGEAAGLRRKDCDLLRSRLNVSEALSEVNGYLYRVKTKTYEQRTVVLPPFVRDLLEKHLEEHVDSDGDALVFTSPDGDPLRYGNFRKRAWDLAVNELDVLPNNLTPHHLRHTCASLLVKNGAHVKAVQEQLGHSSITVTMDIYTHLFPSEMDALATRLGESHRQASEADGGITRIRP